MQYLKRLKYSLISEKNVEQEDKMAIYLNW